MKIKYQSTVDRLEARIDKYKDRLAKSKEPDSSKYKIAVQIQLDSDTALLELIKVKYTIVPDPVE